MSQRKSITSASDYLEVVEGLNFIANQQFTMAEESLKKNKFSSLVEFMPRLFVLYSAFEHLKNSFEFNDILIQNQLYAFEVGYDRRYRELAKAMNASDVKDIFTDKMKEVLGRTAGIEL